MPVVAWVTVVLATLIIAAAALGLIRVIGHLMAVAKTLDGVIAGVGVVADRTVTVPASVDAVNGYLAPVRDFCETV